ncbi:MAG TPA: hypothetical protein VGZ22_15480 [Isosphaeraceae bacterium]|jgi:uncharacterized repeat protein (TIGR01451 family)|nr:hypothetical protein [Isosphaeraceae bacterium]
MVTNIGDSGTGTFRQAILDANASVGAATIMFNIPGSGNHTIAPTSALPEVTNPVTIDGATQPGYAGTPLIELNGSSEGPGAIGLMISAGNSTVRGLALTGFLPGSAFDVGSGIKLIGKGSNVIEGDFVGINAAGSTSVGNFNGVFLQDSANNTIGGTTPAARNLFAGITTGDGLVIDGPGSTGNVVEGNWFGLDPTGTRVLGNVNNILLFNASHNLIGGTTAAARNVIDGALDYGVSLEGSSNGNAIEGNFFGTDTTGTALLTGPNKSFYGVYLQGGSGNTVGGTTPAARNIIAGNYAGVVLGGSTVINNTIEGNYLGTDVTGTKALGNSIGVEVAGPGNLIGGTVPGARNIISGNNAYGILVDSLIYSVRGTVVEGNWIGVDASGTEPLGNGSDAIHFNSGSGMTIGGTKPGAGNIIAYNGGVGVSLVGAGKDSGPFILNGNDDAILSNSIFSNTGLGIDLITFEFRRFGFVSVSGVTPNTPGGPHAGSNNLQNFPVLTSATSAGGSTTIQGTLNSTPNTSFTVQFFSNAMPNPSGFGEGQTLIGQKVVTTDATGNVSFSASFPVAVPPGESLSATATDPAGNTSEFSQDLPVVPVNLSVSQAGPTDPVPTGAQITYIVTLSNQGASTATGVTLVDTVPTGVTLMSAQSNRGTITIVGNTVTLAVASLPGQTLDTRLVLTVEPQGPGLFTNTAVVMASQPNVNSNATSFFTAVVPAPPVPIPAPLVLSVRRIGVHRQPTQLVLTFDEALNPASAQNLHNYLLVTPVFTGPKRHRPDRVYPLVSAVYNPATRTVTLRPAHLLGLHQLFRLTVNGLPPLGITNEEGTSLDGAGVGIPGSNFVAYLRGFATI